MVVIGLQNKNGTLVTGQDLDQKVTPQNLDQFMAGANSCTTNSTGLSMGTLPNGTVILRSIYWGVAFDGCNAVYMFQLIRNPCVRSYAKQASGGFGPCAAYNAKIVADIHQLCAEHNGVATQNDVKSVEQDTLRVSTSLSRNWNCLYATALAVAVVAMFLMMCLTAFSAFNTDLKAVLTDQQGRIKGVENNVQVLAEKSDETTKVVMRLINFTNTELKGVSDRIDDLAHQLISVKGRISDLETEKKIAQRQLPQQPHNPPPPTYELTTKPNTDVTVFVPPQESGWLVYIATRFALLLMLAVCHKGLLFAGRRLLYCIVYALLICSKSFNRKK